MKVPMRYPTLVWTAIVATVFSLVVGLLMTLAFVGRGTYELFDDPAYLVLKQQLKDQPGDAQVQQAIRELDLHLRDIYFRNRRFMEIGVYLLLGGVALASVAARWAVSMRGTTYEPRPVDFEIDEDALMQRYAKWATVGVVAIVTAVLCGFAFHAEPIVPDGIKQLASEPTTKPLTSVAQDGSTSLNPKPQIAPEAAAALPSYDDYLQQWPRFRGPTGSGVSRFADVPAQWSVPDNTGILWKTAVPLPGPNSPVVWQRRIFLSGATAEKQAVFCFGADDGTLQWRHDLPPTKPEAGELEVTEATGYAAPTMATDGLRVYAIFATGDVVALSLEGQELWHKNLGVPKNHYGHASALATYNDLLIVQLDQAMAEDGLSRLLGAARRNG